MLLLVVIMVLPFAWMLSTSLKAQEYILQTPPELIPNPVTLESYTGLAERIDLGRTFFNSMFVAVVGTIGQIIVAAMAAFAFARMQWRGRNTVFLLYLVTMMIPSVVLVIPQFILVRSLGWINSYMALIVPPLFSAFGTFLLRQSFLGLPKDFEEAAFVDGANYFTIFWRIILPLSQPALATLAVFSFMGLWNAYLWPLFVARRDVVMTLPVALATLQASPRALTEWNMVMAGAVVTVLPILLIYMLAQRWFVSGIISGGIKG
ncbi:carbohydrate ABC transporter permease [Phototrophicus methaneseepsis]|uniref:Carbohydrate ABC transporter permease n=2 Tax=Phototrophicus methaneseepsis TaxID=2710758 RepID=A0A7S8EE08_9CHLR|nr:carbohydrate ABC transporter permease [Phototrophicus methaneseepsis]